MYGPNGWESIGEAGRGSQWWAGVVSDPISSYIVGPCTCTETMALNGYINICILWQEFSNWFAIYIPG